MAQPAGVGGAYYSAATDAGTNVHQNVTFQSAATNAAYMGLSDITVNEEMVITGIDSLIRNTMANLVQPALW